MLRFKCKDVGLSDRWSAQSRSNDRLLDTVAIHMRSDHDIIELSPAMVAKVRKAFTYSPVFHNLSAADMVLYQYNCEGDPACTKEYIEEAEHLLKGTGRTSSGKAAKTGAVKGRTAVRSKRSIDHQ